MKIRRDRWEASVDKYQKLVDRLQQDDIDLDDAIDEFHSDGCGYCAEYASCNDCPLLSRTAVIPMSNHASSICLDVYNFLCNSDYARDRARVLWAAETILEAIMEDEGNTYGN